MNLKLFGSCLPVALALGCGDLQQAAETTVGSTASADDGGDGVPDGTTGPGDDGGPGPDPSGADDGSTGDDGPSGPVCGDGQVEGDEQCDLGASNGTGMYCRADCQANTCPDGYVGPGEICDDGNVNNLDECSNACGPASCGDGEVQTDAGEQCDAGAGNSLTGACLPSCLMASCGDGNIHAGVEMCDGTDVAGQSCEMQDFDGGTIVCDATCLAFDTGSCYACGNGLIEANEDCDGPGNLGGETCMGLGFVGGALGCNASCLFATGGCHNCGNAVIDAGEDCDGGVPAGQTCANIGMGFSGGTLSCSACNLVTTGCFACGDGTINMPSEECDSGNFGGVSCGSLGFNQGELVCTACQIDDGACCQSLGTNCGAAEDCCAMGASCMGQCCLPRGLACENDTDCCGDLDCGGADSRCCIASGQPCGFLPGPSQDMACCSGTCQGNGECQ
jgi:cysteine-rich repeat protein